MKVLVYGAGVLGSLYAARLQDAGNDVSLLARGPRLADLRAQGIVLQDARTGTETVTRVTVVERLAPDDAYELVIVLVRKNQIPSVLPDLAANRNTPNVLFLGNNAAGAEEYVRALGRERVLLGFASSGGTRQGHVIRYAAGMGGRRPRVTIGETDGGLSLRLQAIVGLLEGAGFQVDVSPHMDAWLWTHAALVVPIAGALYLAGGDNKRLARTRDGLVLLVRAAREGFQVLHAGGVPLLPAGALLYEWLPEPLLVFALGRLMQTELARLALAAHANVARDEMQQLASELHQLARATGAPTPALNRLDGYINPAMAPIPVGRANIPLDWFGVWVSAAVVVGLALFVIRFRPKAD
ncbi:MAG: 2-dehydropantoate 2-reductase N-terminal domain-containing protein [Anaerolineae bacterium]